MIERTMTYSIKDGLKLDIPNANKIEGEIIGTIWEEISEQIGTLLPFGDLCEWQKADWALQELGNRTFEIPVFFPKGFDGKFSDKIKVKTEYIKNLEDVKTLIQATMDKADECGYIAPDYDSM